MAPHRTQIAAFDLYGTLLSTESIAKELASHFGDQQAKTIAATWRRYQLEYTWRLNSMNQYIPFSDVTRSSLRHALDESSVQLSSAQIDDLMTSYDSLSTFPDVDAALEALKQHSGIESAVFSNGTDAMVKASVDKSQDLKPHRSIFKTIVTVEDVQRYKPHPDVYRHLAKQVGLNPDEAADMASIWLISGNPFDIVGARAMGLQAVWVDRAGTGWQDKLPGDKYTPTAVVRDLEAVVQHIANASD